MTIRRAAFSCGIAAVALVCGGRSLQNAVAEGDTRTISLHHIHTNEDITITFKRDGRYDEAALNKLNWFLRDWRKEQETKMDPHLIDLIWEVQREAGSNQPVWVVCGYRSPETNAMLRRRSAGVARFSQHMLGHAMDFYIPGVPLERLREMGLRLQRGGVGFYPTSGSPFVHMDTGGVRMWPRMSREQLVRVFPDQRTAYIPSDGRPLAGYQLALADIKNRGGEVSAAAGEGEEGRSFNPFKKLLHLARGNDDEETDATPANATGETPAASEPLRTRAKAAVASAVNHVEDKVAAGKQRLAQAAASAATKAEDKLAVQKAKLAAAAGKAEEKLAAAAEKAKEIKLAAKTRVFGRGEAATTANDVIVARGFWQGVPDGMAAVRSADSASSAVAAVATGGVKVADAGDGSTGTVALASAADARAQPAAALAYADPADSVGLQASAANDALRAALIRTAMARGASDTTTVALKGGGTRPAAAIYMVAMRKASPLLADATRLADPWLRAIIVSPSVQRFLNITALGARDFRALADLMVKPAAGVMMTFAAEPNPGLDHNRFTGGAVSFVPTVSYTLRTAQLQ